MTATPMTTEELRARYILLRRQAEDIAAEMSAIADVIRAQTPVGKHEVGDGHITVSVNRRFDEITARAVLTPDEIAACTAPKLDSALVKKLVAPLRYETCMKVVGDPKVQIS